MADVEKKVRTDAERKEIAETAEAAKAAADSGGVAEDREAKAATAILEVEKEVKKSTKKETEEKIPVEKLNEKELSEKTGLDIPLVRGGKIEKTVIDSLRADFDKLWEEMGDEGWDMYDVRKKQAEYLVEHDDGLKELDAQALNKLIRNYYAGERGEVVKDMKDALERLKQIPHHEEFLNGTQPDRKKATSKFIMSKNDQGKWEIAERLPNVGIAQPVVEEDLRSVQRVYDDIPNSIVVSPAFQTYLLKQVDLALIENPDATEMEVEAWYMSTTARKTQPGDNVPEGYHQDGYPYIDNLVIRRDEEIEGGDSILYFRNTETGEIIEINRAQLKEGEHLGQKDDGTNLWHDATPFFVRADAEGKEYRRDILGSAVTVLPRKEKEEVAISPEQKERIENYKRAIAIGDGFLTLANGQDDISAQENYLRAKDQYEIAQEIMERYPEIGEPEDFVKIVDHDGRKFALHELRQCISKIEEILINIKDRGEFWERAVHLEDIEPGKHVPLWLTLQRKYQKSYEIDERGFTSHDPSEGKISYFEARLARLLSESEGQKQFQEIEANIVPQLIRSLGRVPSPAEVYREYEWQAILRQVEKDRENHDSKYYEAEIGPQQEIIDARAELFPKDPTEFERGAAKIENIEILENGIRKITTSYPERPDPSVKVEPEIAIDEAPFSELSAEEVESYKEKGAGKKLNRLLITTHNANGEKMIDHPVMTDEETEWVEGSAEMIAHYAKGGKVFIAGLGLEMLNKRLKDRGIAEQVVAEYNRNVIDLGEFSQKEASIDVRQGDWREVLQAAIDRGERFEAISIDAFPNSADDVNRDASSREALELAYKALKPGGVLTFYPDSRYIPPRVWDILSDMGIPNSSIHYTVEQFDTSNFTGEYHYGDLMAVPWIQKPRLENKETRVQYESEYKQKRASAIEGYLSEHTITKGAKG